MCELVGFCALTTSEQAAWVQAIFSVVAIVVAILVPYRMERNRQKIEERNGLRKARGYALRLLNEVRLLRRLVVNARFNSSEEFAEENIDAINDRLQISAELRELVIVLHEVGVAGLHLQDALMLIDRSKLEMDEEYIRLTYAGTEHDEDGALAKQKSVDFGATLAEAQAKLDLVFKELQKLFPDVAPPA